MANEMISIATPYAEVPLEELMGASIERFITIIESADDDDLEEMWGAIERSFAFDGYDPSKVFNALKSKAIAGGVSEMMKEMSILIFVFIHRGNDIQKILSKTAEAGRRYLQNLKDIFGIVKDPRTAPEGRQLAITLPRIASVFPPLVAKVLFERPPPLVIRLCSEYHLPVWAAAGGLMAIFPQDPGFKNIAMLAKSMFFMYNTALSHFLNSQNPTLPGPNAQTILNILNSSHISHFLSEDSRFLALWASGLLTVTENTVHPTYFGLFEPECHLTGLYDHLKPLRFFKRKHPEMFNQLMAVLPATMSIRGISTPDVREDVFNLSQTKLKVEIQSSPTSEEAHFYRTRFSGDGHLFDVDALYIAPAPPAQRGGRTASTIKTRAATQEGRQT